MGDIASAATGAAVSGGLGIISSGLNYLFNKKLAAQQNEYNIDMWKMQADYNSPQAQMQRFSKAGLNPNLIYGQGTNGNMSDAPQLVTPEAPDFSKEAIELGRAFNIESIRTLISDRKKAQAEAKIAEINADREEAHFDADKQIGATFDYDMSNGLFKPVTTEGYFGVENYKAANYYKMQHLAENYRQNMLLNSRAQLLNAQYRYLQPQTLMSWYEHKYQPYSFWIGQGSKILNSLPLPKLRFNFGSGSQNYQRPFRSY